MINPLQLGLLVTVFSDSHWSPNALQRLKAFRRQECCLGIGRRVNKCLWDNLSEWLRVRSEAETSKRPTFTRLIVFFLTFELRTLQIPDEKKRAAPYCSSNNMATHTHVQLTLSRLPSISNISISRTKVSVPWTFLQALSYPLSRTNFLVPCEFEIERVNCIYT